MRLILPVLAAIAVGGCTQSAQSPSAGESPQSVMVRVAKQVQACWFGRRKEPAMTRFRMASEVNSPAGRPRILIVPRNRPEALPQLVAQAERQGGRTQFSSFGPLYASKDGPRLRASLEKWAAGSQVC